jgi:SAM-dependent methyltransferase
MSGPTLAFWQEHFETGVTPWDRGEPGPQLLRWLGSTIAKDDVVLVPGCGAGWDVAALAAFGAHTIGVDYAPAAVERTRALLASRDLTAEVVEADVLAWSPSTPVDVVYEQTCLCALHPDHWIAYATQLDRWLKPGGALCAMFMNKPRPGGATGFVEGPPYHCDINAMRALFPSTRWVWPKPPYEQTPHAIAAFELGVVLRRKA